MQKPICKPISLLLICFFSFTCLVNAQIKISEESYDDEEIAVEKIDEIAYQGKMITSIALLDKAMTTTELYQAAQNFNALSNEYPNEWLPPYYGSYCYTVMGTMVTRHSYGQSFGVIRDQYLDQAQLFIDIAKKKGTNHPEILIVQAYIYQLKFEVDPVNRMEEYGTLSVLTLEDAEIVDPNNPRIGFLRAQNTFFTPEVNGGGLIKACPIVKATVAKYEARPPENEIDPKWGAAMTHYMSAVCASQGL